MMQATTTGNNHHAPNATTIATNTGASAVPSPSRALSASTALSVRSGKNASA